MRDSGRGVDMVRYIGCQVEPQTMDVVFYQVVKPAEERS